MVSSAASELIRRGWVFHTHYKTWFQLQGLPRVQADDRIEGKFKFFDFEEGKINKHY